MKNKVQLIVLHCFFTPADMHVTPAMLARWGRERGWKHQLYGYRGYWHQDGTYQQLVPDNGDAFIDPWEVTNGARGHNHHAEHYAYAGGMQHGKPWDTRTFAQRIKMMDKVLNSIKAMPWVRVAGHNQLDTGKECPCFNVPAWLHKFGIPQKNIYQP